MANNLRFDPSTWHDARVRRRHMRFPSPPSISKAGLRRVAGWKPQRRRPMVELLNGPTLPQRAKLGSSVGYEEPNLKTKHRGISSLIRGRLGCDPQPVLEGRKVYLSCPKH